jgi:hypothetical protein
MSLADDVGPASVYINRLSGKFLSSTYLGEMAEHLVGIAGVEAPVKAFEINPRQLSRSPGSPITLLLPAEHVMLLQA